MREGRTSTIPQAVIGRRDTEIFYVTHINIPPFITTYTRTGFRSQYSELRMYANENHVSQDQFEIRNPDRGVHTFNILITRLRLWKALVWFSVSNGRVPLSRALLAQFFREHLEKVYCILSMLAPIHFKHAIRSGTWTEGQRRAHQIGLCKLNLYIPSAENTCINCCFRRFVA